MKVKLITTNSPLGPGIAAKQCYNQSFHVDDIEKLNSDELERVVDHCIDHGHTSVIEHFYASFLIEGISLVTIQQLTRHRIASYTQRSLRYTKLDPNIEWYYVPDEIAKDEISLDRFIRCMKNCASTYDFLVNDRGIHQESARYCLPVATTSNIYVTMNARSLMNFFQERLCIRAQNEIRLLAHEMKQQLKNDSNFKHINKIAKMKCGACLDKSTCKAFIKE